MKLIPKSVKLAIIVGMGLQIAFIGLTSVDIVVANSKTIVGLGPMDKQEVWISIAGLVFIGTLLYHRVTGAILIGIVAVSLATWSLQDSFPTHFLQLPNSHSFMGTPVDLATFNLMKMLPSIAAFLFIGIVDVSGVVFGMSSLAGITDKHGDVPGALYAFLGCGIATSLGACIGSTPIIVYVESAAGIKDGGRTGITGIVVGLLFLLSVIFAPLFASVPATYASPSIAPITALYYCI